MYSSFVFVLQVLLSVRRVMAYTSIVGVMDVTGWLVGMPCDLVGTSMGVAEVRPWQLI